MNVSLKSLTPDSLASIRDWLHDEGEAWFLPSKAAPLVKAAVAALRGGCCFDFGVVPRPAEPDSYVDAAVSLVEQGAIGLPYSTFIGLARFVGTGGEVGIVMIVAETDDGLRPHRFLHFSAGTPARPTSLLNLRRIGYDGGGRNLMPFDVDGRDGGDRRAERHFRRLALLLGLIADQRIPHNRIEAPTSLNTARRARGRPPIPARWTIDAASWVTKISGIARDTARAVAAITGLPSPTTAGAINDGFHREKSLGSDRRESVSF